jgi:hypothetical protein
MGQQTPREWLAREDGVERESRMARLSWLAAELPKIEYLVFPGGLVAKQLFQEARYCFTYGQFLATIVLGLAYIEHTLAGLLYAAGRSDLERAGASKLLMEATELGWLSVDEVENLDRARGLRNAVTHFRAFGRDDSVEVRAVFRNQDPYIIIEEDARHVMKTAFHILSRYTV